MAQTDWRLVFVFLMCCGNAAVERQRTKYSVEELLKTRYPSKLSCDIDLDPCKAGKLNPPISNHIRFVWKTYPIIRLIFSKADSIGFALNLN